MAKTKAQARKERVAQLRAQQKRQDRRHAFVIWGIVAVVVVLLAGFVSYELIRRGNEEPLSGVKTYQNLSRDHVTGAVNYEMTPPAGGPHQDIWLNCGVYDEPVPNENAVHSLEHGAVWVTYRPDLPADQVEKLRDTVGGDDFLLLSPYENLPAPVVASAWGVQVQLENADDPRLDQFIREYRRGPQTPEPRASCTGGVGNPISS